MNKSQRNYRVLTSEKAATIVEGALFDDGYVDDAVTVYWILNEAQPHVLDALQVLINQARLNRVSDRLAKEGQEKE